MATGPNNLIKICKPYPTLAMNERNYFNLELSLIFKIKRHLKPTVSLVYRSEAKEVSVLWRKKKI